MNETEELVSSVNALLDNCAEHVSQLESGFTNVAGSSGEFSLPAALPRLRLLEGRVEAALQAMEGQSRQQRSNDASDR